MPTQVIRNGKTYYEYTPQELDAAKLAKVIGYQVKHGPGRQAVSPLVSGAPNRIIMKRTGECHDTCNMNN